MNKNKLTSLTIRLFVLLAISTITASIVLYKLNQEPSPDAIRVACVGDSLTQLTGYPFELEKQLGRKDYIVRNFGVGSTAVSLDSDTAYMDTTAFQNALEFQPEIVIIMLGTNDAQPSFHIRNVTFVGDYMQLVAEFQKLSNDPEIWIVLPPPIFNDQGGKISSEYFANILIPLIEQVANEANLPLIDVYSALAGYPEYFPDGVHPTSEAAELIAIEVYKAIK